MMIAIDADGEERRVWLPLDSKFCVCIDRENLTIPIYEDGAQIYEIDLAECTNSAELLDWIMQIHGKTWCTSDLMSEVLETLNAACLEYFDQPVQGVFCPMGNDRKVEWPKSSRLSLVR